MQDQNYPDHLISALTNLSLSFTDSRANRQGQTEELREPAFQGPLAGPRKTSQTQDQARHARGAIQTQEGDRILHSDSVTG